MQVVPLGERYGNDDTMVREEDGEAHALPSMDDRREGWCRLRYMTCWPSMEDQWKL